MENTNADGNQKREETQSAVDRGDLTVWEYLTKIYDNNEMLDDNSNNDSHDDSFLRSVAYPGDIADNISSNFSATSNCDWSAVDHGDLSVWGYITKVYDNNEMLDDDDDDNDDSHADAILQSAAHSEDIADNSSSTVNAPSKMDCSTIQEVSCSSYPMNYNYNKNTTTKVNVFGEFQHKGALKSLQLATCMDQNNYPATNSTDIEHLTPSDTIGLSASSMLHEDMIVDSLPQHPNKCIAESVKCSMNQLSEANETATLFSKNIYHDKFDAASEQPEEDCSITNPQSNQSQSAISLTTSAIDFTAAVIEPHVQTTTWTECIPPYQQYNDPSLLLKPLNAYNYFYRHERDNIIQHITHANDPLPAPVSDFSNEKMEQMLKQRLFVDPLKAKRVHRKTHGKISFYKLSKIISERWQQLPRHGRDFYRNIAEQDEIFYQQHLMKLITQNGNFHDASNGNL